MNSSNKELQIGCLSKITEVIITHPLIILKNNQQVKKKIKIRHLYSGLNINIINMALITGTKFYINDYLNNNNYTKQNKITNSFIAGSICGILRTPFEYTILNNIKINNIKINKNLFNGTACCIFREGIYSTSLFNLIPYIQNKYDYTQNDIRPSIYSGFICGLLTHPFDTLKTYKQYNSNINYIEILKKNNIKNIYNGLIPRTIKICSSLYLLSFFSNFYSKII